MSKKTVRKFSAFLAAVMATLSVVSLSGAQITAKAETVSPTRLSVVSFTKDLNHDFSRAIKTASGYVAVGSASRTQPFIALLDKEGNETSSYVDSEVTGEADATGLSDIIQTSDGGYLAVGYNGGSGLIYKMDAGLNLVWKKTTASGLHSITKTDDGHYLTGFGSKFYKIDENETVDVTITLNTSFLENLDIYKIIPAADGYFAVGCVAGPENGVFAKYRTDGTLIWSKNVGNVSFGNMTKDSQGHYVLAGTSAPGMDVEGCNTKNLGEQDAILACFDGDGNRLWVSDYGNLYTDYFGSVEADGDNLFALGFGDFGQTTDSEFVGIEFTDPKVTAPAQPSSPSSGSGIAASTKSVSGTSSQGITKATFSTADINALSASDNVQVALGGTTIRLPASVLKNFAGSGFSVSTSSPDKATSGNLLQVMGSDKDLVAAFNFDAQTSSGSAIHQLGANVEITVSLTDDMMAKIRQLPGVKLFYYNPETNTLEDMHATFNLNSKTVTFTTSHFSTYVIASSTVRTSANPQTGDNQNVFVYVTLLFVAALGAVYFLMHKKSTKKC